MVDLDKREVNSKGYLVDGEGNVINKRGLVIFKKNQLSPEGEIPKLFPFTKFNVDSIIGCLEKDDKGRYLLQEGPRGETVDMDGRRVNSKGYLIDKVGNIIDRNGNRVFDKDILDEEGEIPKIFRKGVLRKDSTEDLKGIWAMIEKDKKKVENGQIDEDPDESEDEHVIDQELKKMG